RTHAHQVADWAGAGVGWGSSWRKWRYARQPSRPMNAAATNSSAETRIIASAPQTAIPAPSRTMFGTTTVSQRLRAMTSVAAIVVMYMNTVGISAKVVLRRVEASQTVTTSSESDAISWFDDPNSCQR